MKIFLFIIVLILAGNGFAQSDLTTNSTIIELHKSGIPATVIIAKINNSKCLFETDVNALKILVEAAVPDDVIAAMIAKQPTISPIKREPPPFVPIGQLSKTERKARLKSAATIEIAAASDKISQILLSAFQGYGYRIDGQSSNSILLTRQVKGVGAEILAGMVGNDNVQHEIRINISEVGGISRVVIDLSISMENRYGKRTRSDLNNKEKDRVFIESVLTGTKSRAENEQ